MVLIERTKEETYVRYRIRPLSNAVIGAEKTFNKLRTAELNAMYWAHETGSYYEIIEEEVHAKSIKVIAQDRTEVKEARIDEESRKRVKELADKLYGFRWRATKDGIDYWDDVHRRLCRIAEEGY